jgi:virginiamycin B lyase
MLSFAGPDSRFPVISRHVNADSTARWLMTHLPEVPPAAKPRQTSPDVTEFMIPAPNDLPHDVAVLKDGRVLITGMFTHRMYLLDPASGAMETVAIPVNGANPRAVEVDAEGKWWVVLGGPQTIAIYDPRDRKWSTHHVGMYPHSIALDGSRAWYNGHFSVNPELIGSVDAAGTKKTFDVPAHPTMPNVPGPIPYELRVSRDGAVWGSELQGNRVFRFDPKTETFQTWALPTSHAGPRRLDIDAAGKVWIPQYGAGNIAVLDPVTDKIAEIALPIANTAPYIVRVDDQRGWVWIATGQGDVAFRYDTRNQRFTTYHLPSAGALVRHMDIDEKSGVVWLAYGASPGIPARIARIRPN